MTSQWVYSVCHLATAFAVVLFNYGVVIEHLRRVFNSEGSTESNSHNHTNHSRGAPRRSQLTRKTSRSGDTRSSLANASSAQGSSVNHQNKHSQLNRNHHRNSMMKMKKKKKSEHTQRVALVMTLICIISSLIRSTQGLYLRMVSFRLLPLRLHCTIMIQSIAVLFATTKSSLYCVMTNRVDAAFGQSAYAYSYRTIRICYSIIIMEWICVVTWAPFAIGSFTSRDHYAPNGQRVDDSNKRGIKICAPLPGLLISAFAVLFDIIFMGSMVLMFIRPLRKIFALQPTTLVTKSNNNNNKNHSHRSTKTSMLSNSNPNWMKLEFKLLPIKYTVLSVVAVTTSCIALILLGIGWDIAQTVDNPINVCCLLLMTHYWKSDYWCLCGPLLRTLRCLRLVNEDTHQSIVLMIEHSRELGNAKEGNHHNDRDHSRNNQINNHAMAVNSNGLRNNDMNDCKEDGSHTPSTAGSHQSTLAGNPFRIVHFDVDPAQSPPPLGHCDDPSLQSL